MDYKVDNIIIKRVIGFKSTNVLGISFPKEIVDHMGIRNKDNAAIQVGRDPKGVEVLIITIDKSSRNDTNEDLECMVHTDTNNN